MSRPSSFLCLFVLLLTSCSAAVWNIPLPKVKDSLAKGDYSLFKDLKIKNENLNQSELLGEGAAYYMGFVFREAGRPDLEEASFALSLQQGIRPWAWESGQELVESFLKSKNYSKAENYARQLLTLDPQRRAAQRLLLESLYWQKKDKIAWDILKTWEKGDFSDIDEAENLLFKAVLRSRMDMPGWQDDFLRLCLDYPAQSLHYRAQSFFEEDTTRYYQMTPWGAALIKFKSALSQGKLAAAATALQNFLKEGAFWDSAALLDDWELLNRGPVQALKGAEFLVKLRPLIKNNLYALDLNLGRMYRQGDRWAEAKTALELALKESGDAAQWDRALWLLLSSAFRVKSSEGLSLLTKYQSQWRDPSFYSDLFSSWLNQSFLDRRYSDIALVYKAMGQKTAPVDRGDYAYILARLASARLIDLAALGITESAAELYRVGRESKPFSYSSFMSYAAEGVSLGLTSDIPSLEAVPTAEAKAMESWVVGFIQFGLVQKAFDLIMQNPENYSSDLLRGAVSALAAQQLHRPALRLTYAMFEKPGFKPRRADWELLYPRPFKEMVEARAKAEKLDPALFYGLLREESAFESRVKSFAGAIGLSQLMPDTAADVARRMGLKEIDIKDPLTNLTLGARYLSMRIENFGKGSLALMAYNAGIGRVRGWVDTMTDLPDELFAEAVPIKETRLYVKKILTASIMYGLLYYNRNLNDVVHQVYPNF